jgi:hypothetical protein
MAVASRPVIKQRAFASIVSNTTGFDRDCTDDNMSNDSAMNSRIVSISFSLVISNLLVSVPTMG